MFGIFEGTRQFSSVAGYLLTTYLLGSYGVSTYYIVLLCLAGTLLVT